jgi:hypothetical protein
MLRRPLTRLTTAVAAASAICALGVGAALAAPAATWSPPSPPIPGAFTNSSPALSSITFPNPIGQGLFAAWRGTGVIGHIHYRYRTPSLHGWSHLGTIPGAFTSSAPAAAGYTDPFGRGAVLAVWEGTVDNLIWYSQGQTLANGGIDWTTPASLPATIRYAKTFAAPRVFFLDHSSDVMVSWRGPANHVRYSIGTPVGRGFSWSQSKVIPGSPSVPTGVQCLSAPCTRSSPAITEMTTSTTSGTLFVFWTQYGGTGVFYSSATDTATTDWAHPGWTAPAQVPGAATLPAPAVSVPTVNSIGPLLLVYKAPFTTNVRFQTLTGTTWSAPGVVPGDQTAVAPALLQNLLATTTPTSIGNIILRHYG